MQEWLTGVVGESAARLVTVALAAAVVIVLAVILFGLAKRIFAGTGGIGGRTRAPRLAVLEFAAVDTKRRLVLVRRDDTEHLILIGGQNDLVVEPGIQRGSGQRRPARPDGQPRREPEVAPPVQSRRFPVRQEPSDEVEADAPTPVAAPMAAAREPVAREPGPSSVRRTAPEIVPPVAGPAAEPARTPVIPIAPPEREETPAPRPQTQAVAAPALDAPIRTAPIPAVASPARVTVAPVPPAVPAAAMPVIVPVQRDVVSAQRDVPTVQPMALGAETAPTAAPAPAPRVEMQTPVSASEPTVSAKAPAVQPEPEPVRESAPKVAAALAPPGQPRSMATPTLPQTARETATVSSSPAMAVTRSLWGNEVGRVTVNPIPPVPQPSAADAQNAPDAGKGTGTAATPAAPAAASGAANAIVAPTQAGPAEEIRQPLSVRSFATTIQARKSSGPTEPAKEAAPIAVPPAPAPASPPVQAPAPSIVVPPRVEPALEARTNAPPTPRVEPDVPPVPSPGSEAAPAREGAAARPLTLEEEMERLLHDFTIDVSDRR